MTVSMDLSFDNTETAFAYKSDKELKSGRWLLKTMHYPWFVAVGSRLTPFLMKTGLPVHGIAKPEIVQLGVDVWNVRCMHFAR